MHYYKLSLQLQSFGLVYAALVSAVNNPNHDTSLNFRPDNVTFNGLYDWVGSYYNGTTLVSVKPFSGISKKEIGEPESSLCPNLEGKEFKAQYDSILGLTEPGTQNVGNNPVNAFYTLWDEGFDFSTLKDNETIGDYPWSWGLFSSDPAVAKNQTNIQNSFNFTVEKSKADTYNFSSTLGNSFYSGSRFSGSKNINYNMTVCNGTKDLSWEGAILNKKLWSEYNSNVTYPDPILDLRFDDNTANLTLHGYTMTSPSCGEKAKFCPADVIVYAEIEITFLGTIDAYHSDKLETNGTAPKWEKRVGFQNGTQSADKTNGSTRQEHCGLPSLLICAFSLLVAISYI